jgi:hypothetical protein
MSIKSIASDNKKMLEFMITSFTYIIRLVYSVVQAIGSWIPFT